VLVLAVIFLFIGGRSAFFVALSIPLSMMITFAALYFAFASP
jgi:multidrug efflux pump